MEPDGHAAPGLGVLHDLDDLLQGHGRAVVHRAALLLVVEQGGVDQGAGVDDHVGLPQQLRPPHRDQILRSGARADKMYHGFNLLCPVEGQQGLRAGCLS